jgi:hypothetical protein
VTLLRGLTIRQKLIRVMMVTSVSSIVLTCLAFVAFDVRAFRAQAEHELISVAQVIGANTTAALSFDDARAASETLAALRAEPRIVAARLFDAEGKPFADYRDERVAATLPTSVADVEASASSRLTVLRPILLDEGRDDPRRGIPALQGILANRRLHEPEARWFRIGPRHQSALVPTDARRHRRPECQRPRLHYHGDVACRPPHVRR